MSDDDVETDWVIGKRKGRKVRYYNMHTGAWDGWTDAPVPDRSPALAEAMLELVNTLARVYPDTCPRCGGDLDSEEVRNALSRVDNETYICNDCGTKEALADHFGQPLPPVDERIE